jgi:hypothetical protein
MKTYLSIDLDYWSECRTERTMLPFIEKALSLQVPTLVVKDHHWLTSHANAHPAEQLINVDYHDDIASRPCDFGEGTWASFVKWRHPCAVFEWRYPTYERGRYGRCDEEADVYNGARARTGWCWTTKRLGVKDIPWNEVVAVGIALSPDYWSHGSVFIRDRWGIVVPCYDKVLTRLLGHNDHARIKNAWGIRRVLVP